MPGDDPRDDPHDETDDPQPMTPAMSSTMTPAMTSMMTPAMTPVIAMTPPHDDGSLAIFMSMVVDMSMAVVMVAAAQHAPSA